MSGTSPDSAETPIRILMTADAVGGVWSYSLDLIQGITARGAEVLLATMGPRPSEDQRRQLAAIPNVTLTESDYALEWMSNPWEEVDAAGKWLLDLARNFHPDLVHLNGYVHSALPWRAPVLVVAHSCVFSWWRAVHACAPGSEWNEYKRRVLEGLTAARAVIAPSAAMGQALSTEYGVPGEKMRVIHNFSFREMVQPEDKEDFFLAAGRVWDKAKNIGLLEHIAARLNWEIRVSGSDRGPETFTPAIDSVRFVGMLPYSELLRQMARASIFVHPALYEPFGLAVLEAASASCCLVLADIPTLRELWDGAAVFVDPRNPEQWVDQLNRLAAHEEQRRSLGRLAHAHAARYSADSGIRQYQQAYQSVLSQHRSSNEAAA